MDWLEEKDVAFGTDSSHGGASLLKEVNRRNSQP